MKFSTTFAITALLSGGYASPVSEVEARQAGVTVIVHCPTDSFSVTENLMQENPYCTSPNAFRCTGGTSMTLSHKTLTWACFGCPPDFGRPFNGCAYQPKNPV